jgi:hypothetical protein
MHDLYWQGYEAALTGNFTSPFMLGTVAYALWWLGNTVGHQVLCAALEHIAKDMQDEEQC